MKFFKILGITLASLVGVVVITIGVALYVVFTPKHLTAVADKVAREYISCDYRLGDVELTFFSTFPEFGLKCDGLLVLNPMEGAQSDTLLAASKLVARIELKQLLQDGCLNIRELVLRGVHANAYIAADGRTNYDVLTLPEDTIPDEDSTQFIRSVALEDLRLGIEADCLTLVDERDIISAAVCGVDVDLRAVSDADSVVTGTLSVIFPGLSADYKGVRYAKDADVRLTLPFDAKITWADSTLGLDAAELTVHEAELAINQFKVGLSGWVSVLPEIAMNLDAKTNTWGITPLLALVPNALFTMPEGIIADGKVRLRAHVEGRYDEETWPLIRAHAVLVDATGSYAELPYTLENVQAEANVYLNMNTHRADADIRSLTADVQQSSFEVSGSVTDIMQNMLLDLDLNTHLNLPDIAFFLPKNATAKGKADGSIHMKILLDDLKAVELTNGAISGDMKLANLHATMDSMEVSAPKANLRFAIPNSVAVKKQDKQAQERRRHLGFLSATLGLPTGLDFNMANGPMARLEETTLGLQLGNILKEDVLHADVDVRSSLIEGQMMMHDSLGHIQRVEGTMTKPDLCGYVEYFLKDSTRVPTLALDFNLEHLQGMYDTIAMNAKGPKGSVSMRAGKVNKTLPEVKVKLHLNQLEADLGETMALTTGRLGVNFQAQRSRNKENVLLEWNPQLDCDILNGYAAFAPSILNLPIRVPAIRFAYSNQVFDIDTARVELGKSDFALSGKVSNIGPWLEDKGLLTGQLDLTSSMANIDELLDLTSGIGSSSEDEADAEAIETEADPYMVPKGVDLTLDTHIKEAEALGERLRNLTGRLYVNDGLLVLEQMGFVCKAARLELTAMYKTPRKNHLYTGLDYHMYDIDVAELVNLIPQVDTLLPMLRSFKGAAEFHLAAETYLNGHYELKPSTSRGACSIQGKDLTLLDGETFTKIAKLLTFKPSTENKIDSISAEITLFRKEVDIYPFLVSMDKWMAAVGGQYRPYEPSKAHNYHISLLNPLYLGVDVLTDPKNSDNLKIKLTKCKYAKDFKPAFTKVVDSQAMDIRKIIRTALTKPQED